jgi:hypothetical protein
VPDDGGVIVTTSGRGRGLQDDNGVELPADDGFRHPHSEMGPVVTAAARDRIVGLTG